MKTVALGQSEQTDETRPVRLLLADDDAGRRSLLSALARQRLGALEVLEAADGAEAVQLGLQQRPQIALLDVTMPRVGGIEAAITLRDLRPQMRIAVFSGESLPHRDRVREQRLQLFDNLDPDHALDWVELQAQSLVERTPARRPVARTLSLECSACGYGITGAVAPERCPMCQRTETWVHTPWRPWTGEQIAVGRS